MNCHKVVLFLALALLNSAAAAKGNELSELEIDRGQLVTGPSDFEPGADSGSYRLSGLPEASGEWRARSFGKITWWRAYGDSGGAQVEPREEGITIERSGKKRLFWLEESVDSHDLNTREWTKCRVKRTSQLDRGTRPYLWVEFECVYDAERIQEPGVNIAHEKHVTGNVFVLDAKGAPVCVAKRIPVVDGHEVKKGVPAQIDVDFDAAGYMIVMPRTKYLSSRQKEWIGRRLLAS